MEEAVANTGLAVGSPADVVDQVMRHQDFFGPFQRQLFGVDFAGVPEQTVHEMLDLIGAEVLPVLRREMGVPSITPFPEPAAV
jgi:hypothetical protein